jgi:hypothetical protein
VGSSDRAADPTLPGVTDGLGSRTMSSPMDDLDSRLDALFAGPPGEFTAGRDALARQLRADGQAEDADRVRALRRPSRLAAEINHLVRDDPARIAALLAAEAELGRAQDRVVSGEDGAAALRTAESSEAAALDAFPGGPAIHAALRFAARSEAQREALTRGRLVQDPAADDRAAGLFSLGPAPPRAPSPPKDPPPDELAAARRARAARATADDESDDDRRAREEKVRAAITALDDARRAEQEATEARDEARRRADETETTGARLTTERDDLGARVKDVEAQIAAHKPLAKDAAKTRADAEAAAKAATKARDAAERSARRLTENASD